MNFIVGTLCFALFFMFSPNGHSAETPKVDYEEKPIARKSVDELIALWTLDQNKLNEISFSSLEQAKPFAACMSDEESNAVIFIANNSFYYLKNGDEPICIGDVILSSYLDSFDCISTQKFDIIEKNVLFTLDCSTNYMCTLNYIHFKCMGLGIPFMNRETLENAQKKSTKKAKKQGK